MGSRLRRRALLLGVLGLLPAVAAAQPASAGLEVVLAPPGRIEVALRAPGVRRRQTSDEQGHAWFPQLRPGHYVLAISGLPDIAIDLAPGQCLRVARTSSPTAPTAPPTLGALAQRSACASDPGFLITRDALRTTPRPGDAWSVLRDVPGIVVDRVSVGGSDTAQQSLLVSRGDTGAGARWTLDGVDVTDPAALGSSLVFPAVSILEAMEVRTHSLDVRVRTPGVQVGLSLPEPPQRLRGSAYLRGATAALQSDNLPSALADRVFLRNATRQSADMGAEAGGPLPQARLWLWGAIARSSLRQATFTGHEESLRTTSATLKARFALAGGTASLLGLRSEKVHADRDPTFSASPESRWRQSGPTWLVAAEHTRVLGDISLLGRIAYVDGGFKLEPQGGTSAAAYEDLRGIFQRSYLSFDTHRPRLQMGVEAQAARRWASFEHRLLFGAGLRRSHVTTRAFWPGNGVIGLERQDVFFRAFHLSGFAQPTRDENVSSVHADAEAYAQDEARRGRFCFTLGLRLDRQSGRNLASAVAANPVVPSELPAVAYAGAPARLRWLDVLPRVALGFDLDAERHTSVSARYAAYAAALGAAEVTFDNPLAQVASETYYWLDRNGDHTVQADELDRLRGRLGSSGIDPAAPARALSPNRIDPALHAPRTHEIALGLAHSRGEALRVSLSMAWRRQVGTLWRPLQGLALSDYAIRGAVSGTLLGTPYSVGYYAPASTSRIVPGDGRVLTNRAGYHQTAFVSETALAGRVGRLDWQASAAFTDWREHFDDFGLAVQDPTTLDVEPLRDAGPLAVRAGGLGRTDVFVNARWTAGAVLRARLPWRLAAACDLHAREGFPIPYLQVASTGDPTSGSKSVLIAPSLDTFRLPALALLDARLAREVTLGHGTLTLSLDAYNLLNAKTTLQIARDIDLPAGGRLREIARDIDLPAGGRPREIVRPRILWVGADYRF